MYHVNVCKVCCVLHAKEPIYTYREEMGSSAQFVFVAVATLLISSHTRSLYHIVHDIDSLGRLC